jgi:hypothetical protein
MRHQTKNNMNRALMLALMLLPVMGWGQMVDGINLAETRNLQYVDIYMQQKGLSGNKLVAAVEYGQEVGKYEAPPRVLDESGKPMVFNSLIDALNMFSKWGWELISTYTSSTGGALHAILKRKDIR